MPGSTGEAEADVGTAAPPDRSTRRALKMVGENPEGRFSLCDDKEADFGFESWHLAPLREKGEEAAALVSLLECKRVRMAFRQHGQLDRWSQAGRARYVSQSNRIVAPIYGAMVLALFGMFFPPESVASWLVSWFPKHKVSTAGLADLLIASVPLVTIVGPIAVAWSGWSAYRERSKFRQMALRVATAATVLGASTSIAFWPRGTAALLVLPIRDVGINPVAVESGLRDWTPRLILLLLCITPVLMLLLRPKRSYKIWNTTRGRAEALRQTYFARIMSAAYSTADKDRWPLKLAFEYFRRWQVEVQAAYFERRGKPRHDRAKTKARLVGLCLVTALALLALFQVAAYVASGSEQGVTNLPTHGLAWLELIGTDYVLYLIGFMLLLASGSLYYTKTLAESERNDARYEIMERRFVELTEMTDSTRQVLDDPARSEHEVVAIVRRHVDIVHALMDIEQKDWLRLQDLAMGKEIQSYELPPAHDAPRSPAE